MNVTKATNNEKQAVIEFCQNTFSWGDYISQAWDSWINEGSFLVIHDNNQPVAICHASIYKEGKQVWIEGIRVNEKFRRKGYASKLISESEKIGKQNDCDVAYMIIVSTNQKSLDLAQKLNYDNFETWNFYSLELKKITSKPKIKFASYEKKLPSIIFSSNFFYVNSWRWLPLDNDAKLSLIKAKHIIYSENNNTTYSVAVISESEHFDKTLLITIISSSENKLQEILSYIQYFAYNKNYKRIQVLTKLKFSQSHEGLENKFTFNLMKKRI